MSIRTTSTSGSRSLPSAPNPPSAGPDIGHRPVPDVASGSPIVLAGRGLRHSFGQTPVLRGVDVHVHAGEVAAVMGPSGSGKSTLLHALGGLIVPDAGSVTLGTTRLETAPERRRAEVRLRRIGFVFQFGDLVPELTVAENVELPLRLTGTSRRPARRRARDLLDRLGVAECADRRVNEVSGGQAQRAAVARALVHAPAVLLADEPTGSLDTLTGELVLEALVGAAREQGTAVVLVTHELRVASWADRDILLRDGRVVGASARAHCPEEGAWSGAPSGRAGGGDADGAVA